MVQTNPLPPHFQMDTKHQEFTFDDPTPFVLSDNPLLLENLDNFTMHSPKPFVDDLSEINEQLYRKQGDMDALACVPWKKLRKTPIITTLPTVISWTPNVKPTPFPTGTLWGILMDFRYNEESRPKGEGIVFICKDQTKAPPMDLNLRQLWNWAWDTNNCDETMRFHSLRYALKILCGTKGCPYPVETKRRDGHYPALQLWRVEEWDMTIDKLVKDGVPFFQFVDDIPDAIRPRPPKKPKKPRRRTKKEDAVVFMEGFSFNDLDLPVIIPTHHE